ncbi:MAG: CpsB/CapC family capsule biosynthesis tyrosine phosphatase [Bacteroidota bacterium]|nr:CpsB/CapC family capsule biosynthesis tyrosine phosphatase [Bacteroidota bacterium]
MGLFSRKKQNQSGFEMPIMRLQTDIHSHILPGIDDGAQTVDESILMVESFINQGYTKIITSPHVHATRYQNTKSSIETAFKLLENAMMERNLNLNIEYTAEYHLDHEFLSLIKKNEIISFGHENYILVEFSFSLPPIGVDRVFNMLLEKGYQPVVAHPERYEYWYGNIGLFEKLRDIGYLFQSNINAAAGFYGAIPQRLFSLFAKNGWIDFLGSDAHDAASVEILEQSISLPYVQTALQKGVRNHLL